MNIVYMHSYALRKFLGSKYVAYSYTACSTHVSRLRYAIKGYMSRFRGPGTGLTCVRMVTPHQNLDIQCTYRYT